MIVLEGEVADRVCVTPPRSGSVSLARIAFQACAIDHSAISPFRINHLQATVVGTSRIV
jgi:hypothetical protein